MKLQILSRNFTGHSLVFVYRDGTGTHTRIVRDSQPNWTQILDLYKQGRYEEIIPLFDVAKAVERIFSGNFSVADNKVFFKGGEVSGYLMDRILFFMRVLPDQAQRLVKFAENLYLNPSQNTINVLYKFLEHKGMAITDDGCFLAYKAVRADYYSIHGGSVKVLSGQVDDEGKVFNGVGAKIRIARSNVNPDTTIECSAGGLHVGSWEYANDFKGDSGKMMIVKVNPRDVVAVPDCEGFSKIRVCAYEVVAEEGAKLNEALDGDFDKKGHRELFRDSSGRFVAPSAKGRSLPARDEKGEICMKIELTLKNDSGFFRSFEHNVALCRETVEELFPCVLERACDNITCDIRLTSPKEAGFEQVVLTCDNGFDIDAHHRGLRSGREKSFITPRNNDFIRKLIKVPRPYYFSVTIWVKIS